jgi:hypothetical protein
MIVTKLKGFHRGDREDILILSDTGKIDAATLDGQVKSAHLSLIVTTG